MTPEQQATVNWVMKAIQDGTRSRSLSPSPIRVIHPRTISLKLDFVHAARANHFPSEPMNDCQQLIQASALLAEAGKSRPELQLLIFDIDNCFRDSSAPQTLRSSLHPISPYPKSQPPHCLGTNLPKRSPRLLHSRGTLGDSLDSA
jgi:hypothetical protein